jgi:hypothetical protein
VAAVPSVGRAAGLFVGRTDILGNEDSPAAVLGMRVNRGDNPDDDEQPANAASAIIATIRRKGDQTDSLSSIGWRRGPGSTVIEISNLTQFLILIVILLLIFKPQEITIMMKIKIKRRKVAKHSLNSMAVHPDPLPALYVPL